MASTGLLSQQQHSGLNDSSNPPHPSPPSSSHSLLEAFVSINGIRVRATFLPSSKEISWMRADGKIGDTGPATSHDSIRLDDDLVGFEQGTDSITLFTLQRKAGIFCSAAERKIRFVTRLDFGDDSRSHLNWTDALLQWRRDNGRPKRLIVVVNPISGKGEAKSKYQKIVEPMLKSAGISITLQETERHRHAIDLARGLDLSLYDGIVAVSGDGIPTEILNGFLLRSDWSEAMRFPIGHIPAGSGNGLAKSLLFEAGIESCDVESATFAIISGRTRKLDVSTVSQNGKKFFGVLNLIWGLPADVDVESEKYRSSMGGFRLTFQAVVRILNLRKYSCTFSYLPANPGGYDSSTRQGRNESSSSGSGYQGPATDFSSLDSNWTEVSGEFIMIWSQNVPWAATDMFITPRAKIGDGCMDVVLVRDCPPLKLLHLFLVMGEGKHVDSPLVEYLKVRAFRLTPGNSTNSKGGAVRGSYVCVDGEIMSKGTNATSGILTQQYPMDYDLPFEVLVDPQLAAVFAL